MEILMRSELAKEYTEEQMAEWLAAAPMLEKHDLTMRQDLVKNCPVFFVRCNKVYEVVLHEIGHGIGLKHSYHNADCMFGDAPSICLQLDPLTGEELSIEPLSDRDINTLRLAYAFEDERTVVPAQAATAIAPQIPEPESEFETAYSSREDQQEFINIMNWLDPLVEEKLRSFLVRYPNSDLVPDIKFLIATMKMQRVLGYSCGFFDGEDADRESAIDAFREMNSLYGDNKPQVLLIKLLSKNSSSTFFFNRVFNRVYDPQTVTMQSWRGFYPEFEYFEQTPMAEDLVNIPYSAFAQFAIAQLTPRFDNFNTKLNIDSLNEAKSLYEDLILQYPDTKIADKATAWVDRISRVIQRGGRSDTK